MDVFSDDNWTSDDSWTVGGGDESGSVCFFSSDSLDGVEDRLDSVVRYEPPKTYRNAPEPKKSALRVRDVRESGMKKESSPDPKKVHFGQVHVYGHGVELGYNPSVSWGPPLELSWDVVSSEDYDLDSFEGIRSRRLRRSRGCIRLSPNERRKRLYRAGFTRSEVKEVESSLLDEYEIDGYSF